MSESLSRRSMVKGAAAVAAMVAAETRAWAGPVAARPIAPRVFDPRRYGARGDGSTLDTEPIQRAIDECTADGGGTVLLSPGTYLTGLIRLKSNVTFQLLAGATILGSANFSDFVLPSDAAAATKHPGDAHLIFALNAENVTLLGPGTIDGNSGNYLVAQTRAPVPAEEQYRDVAAFGTQRVHRISPMVEMAQVTNLRVENITLRNSVGWTLRPIGCKQVLIRNVTIRNPINASNTDGIDPMACEDVVIDGCDIVTGDDAICVKSGNFYGGNQASRNVRVTNCRVSTCTNGLIIGPEGPSPIVNTIFEDCEIYGTSGPANERPISGVQVMLWDGSVVDGVSYSRIKMVNVRAPICIRLQMTAGQAKLAPTAHAPFTGSIRNVAISDVTAVGATVTSSITGIPELQPENITLRNISIATDEPGSLAWLGTPVPEAEGKYPSATMFGRLPAYGIYARHVQGLTLDNVTVNSQTHDPRPMLACDEVAQLVARNLSGTPSDPSQPFLDLKNVQRGRVENNRAPGGTGTYLKVSGENSRALELKANDLRQSRTPVARGSEVPPGSVEIVQ